MTEPSPTTDAPDLAERVAELELQVADLDERVEALKKKLEDQGYSIWELTNGYDI